MSYETFEVPGRICLFGDKVDLMGRPVIAAAVSTTAKFNSKRTNDNTVIFQSKNIDEYHNFQLGAPPNLDCKLKYWHGMLKRIESLLPSGFELILNSKIPIASGLSSSAAISIGFGFAVNRLFDLKMDKLSIAELAYQGEHTDLGIMCGRMDQYSIAFGGVTFIETGDQPSVIPLKVPPLPLVVGDSQEERQAQVILNRVKHNINNNDPKTISAFEKIYNCVLEGRNALLKGDFTRIGELMNIHQKQEGILQADTPKLNKLCSEAIKAGALGAKQMGAGGGGCMVAICPDKQIEVAKIIEENGGRAWIYDIFFYS